MATVKKWTLKNTKTGDTLLPQTILEQVYADTNLNAQIATGGVIKRKYMTHDIMVLADVVYEVAAEPGIAHPPSTSGLEKGERYFDFGTMKLYLLWTSGNSLAWMQPAVPDLDRMFVNKKDNKLYRRINVLDGSGNQVLDSQNNPVYDFQEVVADSYFSGINAVDI